MQREDAIKQFRASACKIDIIGQELCNENVFDDKLALDLYVNRVIMVLWK